MLKTIPMLCCCFLGLTADQSFGAAPEESLVYKATTLEGARIRLLKSSTVEYLDGLSAPKLAPPLQYISGHYQTDSYRLTVTKKGKSETVWSKQDKFHRELQYAGGHERLALYDVVRHEKRLALLYVLHNEVCVDVVQLDPSGRAQGVVTTPLLTWSSLSQIPQGSLIVTDGYVYVLCKVNADQEWTQMWRIHDGKAAKVWSSTAKPPRKLPKGEKEERR